MRQIWEKALTVKTFIAEMKNGGPQFLQAYEDETMARCRLLLDVGFAPAVERRKKEISPEEEELSMQENEFPRENTLLRAASSTHSTDGLRQLLPGQAICSSAASRSSFASMSSLHGHACRIYLSLK